MSIASNGLIKPLSSKFTILARCLDAALVVVALYLVTRINHTHFLTLHIASSLLAALFLQIAAEFADIYRSWRMETLWAEARQIIACWFICFSIIILCGGLLGLERWEQYWPQYTQWFVTTLVLLLAWRLLARNLLHFLRVRGYNTRHIAVVGCGELAQETARRLLDCTWGGYTFAGFYDDRQEQANISNSERRRRCQHVTVTDYAGDLTQLVQDARAGKLDLIFFAMPMNAELRIRALASKLANSTVSVYMIPDIFTFELLQSRVINLNGIPAIGIIGEPTEEIDAILKRIEDLVGALLLLALCSLPLLVIALYVKLSSRGPVFFRQTRYGLDGKPFRIWKFRTMNVCEDNPDQLRQARKNDQRLTPIGGFLRRNSLDELPQLLNVIKGEMSIVGPRPHAVAHNELYRGQIPGYMLRHKIKPGITGWAQVNGWRGETDTLEKMRKRIEFDLVYIRNWSLMLDLKILLLTLKKGFSDQNAY